MVHAHHGHSHAPRRDGGTRALAVVLGLTASFAVVEALGGLLTGSLALLADAGHMVSDVASLGIALLAAALARRPATPRRSFGFQRAEILAALANGVTLVAISIWIFVEAWDRLARPPAVIGGWMLAIAVTGLAVNTAGALILSHEGGESLNRRAALRHLLADLLGSVGAVVAAIVILLTGWRYADPLVSVLIGLLVLGSSWGVLREATGVLLEAAPRGVDPTALGHRMVESPGVTEVHDLHVWTITSGFPALAAHVLVGPGEDCHAHRRELEEMLHREFGIEHTTLQVDHEPSRELLTIDVGRRAPTA